MVVGPFLGEVGFELLYWIPFLRRALRVAGVAPEQVTAVTRGGAEAWYGDLAATQADAVALLGADYPAAVARRSRQGGDAKMLTFEPVDREVLAHLAMAERGVVHPSLMYAAMRAFWQGRAGVEWALDRLEVAKLPRPPRPAELDAEPYLLVRLYASETLPRDEGDQAHVWRILRAIAPELRVIVLRREDPLGEHPDWLAEPPDGVTVVDAAGLDVQSAYVAHAERMLSTYGGLSYLGPLFGVRTTAVFARATYNVNHLALARAMFGTRLDAMHVRELSVEALRAR